MPYFSILIPTYNRPRPLSNLLESIALNNISLFTTYEVRIYDNSSDVDYSWVLKKFSCLPIIYKKHSSNLGAKSNFELLQSDATGEYISIISDDDYYEKSHFRVAYSKLVDSNIDVYCAHTMINTDNNLKSPPSYLNNYFRRDQNLTIDAETTLRMYGNHFISTGCIFSKQVIYKDPFIYDLDDRLYLTYLTTKYRLYSSNLFGATYIIANNTQSSLGGSRAGLTISELSLQFHQLVYRYNSIPINELRDLMIYITSWEYVVDLIKGNLLINKIVPRVSCKRVLPLSIIIFLLNYLMFAFRFYRYLRFKLFKK